MEESKDKAVKLDKASPDESAIIAEFQYLMALETENRKLDKLEVEKAVKFVHTNPQYGFYLTGRIQNLTISCLLVTFSYDLYMGCQVWWFQSVFVNTNHRSQGIFKRMFKNVESQAFVNKIPLKLYVEHENKRAQSVYQRLGMFDTNQVFLEDDFYFQQDRTQFVVDSNLKFQLVADKPSFAQYETFLKDSFSLFITNGSDSKQNQQQIINKSQFLLENPGFGGIILIKSDKDAQAVIGNSFIFYELSDWRNGLIIYVYDIRIQESQKESNAKLLCSSLFGFLKQQFKCSLPQTALRVQIDEKQDSTIQLLTSTGLKQSCYRVYMKKVD